MLRKLLGTVCLILLAFVGSSQSHQPKLVVGLVIDQMRWDYLYRYENLYGPNGFKRLMHQGFSCENTFVPYMPAYTAPGHSCIYTGSVPAIHGIVSNNWYDKKLGRTVYCTDDSTVSTIGNTGDAGKMSPSNLWTTTITDELKLSNNFKSKIIGIALKDRGAILPAGHSANAAYWYDGGRWITSSFYMNALPTWVDDFNKIDQVSSYMNKDWNTLLPIEKYVQSTADDEPYEATIKGDSLTTFPHKLSLIKKGKNDAFRTTPFGNTFTLDFAKSAIFNESLGKNSVPDFLCVSISSTDYIGHTFGTNSVEIEDTYLRLDKDIADFLDYLDASVGKGNYLLFLTADHGAAHIPAFLNEHHIPGGVFSDEDLAKELNVAVEQKFGVSKAVKVVMNYQVYLNDDAIAEGNHSDSIKNLVIKILKQKDFVVTAVETEKIATATLPEPQKTMMSNGYNPQRSGDIQFTLKPEYMDYGKKGTTHGLWNPYDSHIPLIWFGYGIKQGKTNRETYMTDISATLAALLNIQMPNGCVGKVITEVMGK